jgi:hypothetical protein
MTGAQAREPDPLRQGAGSAMARGVVHPRFIPEGRVTRLSLMVRSTFGFLRRK